jgi:hypothetical protein
LHLAAWGYYCQSSAPTHAARLQEAILKFKTVHKDAVSKPARFVAYWVSRQQPDALLYRQHAGQKRMLHPAEDKPRSGRPRLEARVPEAKVKECIDALRAGYLFEGTQRAYRQGRGLLECKPFAATARQYSLTWKQLLTICMRKDPRLKLAKESVKRGFTTAQLLKRKRVASDRTRRSQRDPNWHQRVVILDTAHKFRSELLGVTTSVVTHQDNNLAARTVADPRLTDPKEAKEKFAWMIAVSPVGGVAPLVWITGTTGQAPHVVSYTVLRVHAQS